MDLCDFRAWTKAAHWISISGSGTIDMCGGDDVLTLQDGAVVAT